MLFSQRALSSFPHNLTRSAPTPVLLASVPCPSPCPFWFPVPYILTSPQEAFLLSLASRHRKPSASVALRLSSHGQDCHTSVMRLDNETAPSIFLTSNLGV